MPILKNMGLHFSNFLNKYRVYIYSDRILVLGPELRESYLVSRRLWKREEVR